MRGRHPLSPPMVETEVGSSHCLENSSAAKTAIVRCDFLPPIMKLLTNKKYLCDNSICYFHCEITEYNGPKMTSEEKWSNWQYKDNFAGRIKKWDARLFDHKNEQNFCPACSNMLNKIL